MTHLWPLRVYYEDTDFGGIVYYANYLKYIERGRTEYVRDMGVDQVALKENDGIVFAVRRVEADYLAAGKYDDELVVETELSHATGVRMIFDQKVKRGDQVLFSATVTVVAINKAGQATRLPANIRRHSKP
ncbi:tol-pal system-associated acyl-CoA thioesterase [Parasulfitobacter algicola]|uniref:Tol-pal system-associated acyl-CoA thioesterase n=1 Tax=Parasulfitobacter algicola TaxID=2614809 RepID=A0ABX2IT12_9RHOB|nr:tol-pal system-associated acyl-CoA thioesterase [Sulfitobacter algicola]NSX54220.1 tol-pal system-associated acyl-CoA thioesterase [Sulfitobacter algicola]